MIELSQAIHNNKLIIGTALKLCLTLPDTVGRIESTKNETIIYFKDKCKNPLTIMRLKNDI